LKKVDDLATAPALSLDWGSGHTEQALQAVFDHVMTLADEAIAWYVDAKNRKRLYARGIRVLAIVLGATAALLPTVSEIIENTWDTSERVIPAGWTAVLLGIVGALLLMDRFFGFSTGWMRYIDAELKLRQITQEFQLDWEAERAVLRGDEPTREQALAMLARCKAFATQVNTIIRDETSAWIKEFERAISQIDESVKAKPVISEPGALNLTVTNGDLADHGWELSLNGATAERHQGKTAAKRSLIPGRHEITVSGTIGGKTVQAAKVVTVPAGDTCTESVTLT
jgi:hypothetical protein